MEKKSYRSSAINYGIYLALGLSAFTIIGYAVSLELLTNFWFYLLILPLTSIAVGVISTAKAKSILGGFISFKDAFSAYFITIAIAMIISSLVSIVIFNFIDPEAATTIQEIVMEKTRTFMENMGAPESEIDKAMEQAANQDNLGVSAQIYNIAKGLIVYAVIGLIVGLIMKKKDPDAA